MAPRALIPALSRRQSAHRGGSTLASLLDLLAGRAPSPRLPEDDKRGLASRLKAMIQLLPDVLGFLGTLLMVVPYLRHQPLRNIREMFGKVRTLDPDTREAVTESSADLDGYFHRWNRRDYRMTAIGVGLLCLSFAAKLILVGVGKA